MKESHFGQFVLVMTEGVTLKSTSRELNKLRRHLSTERRQFWVATVNLTFYLFNLQEKLLFSSFTRSLFIYKAGIKERVMFNMIPIFTEQCLPLNSGSGNYY